MLAEDLPLASPSYLEGLYLARWHRVRLVFGKRFVVVSEPRPCNLQLHPQNRARQL